MDPQAKKVFVSHDVVFDKVSSYCVDSNADSNIIDLASFYNDVASSKRGNNISVSREITQQGELLRL